MNCIRSIGQVVLCIAIVYTSIGEESQAEPILLAHLYHSQSRPHSPREMFNFIFIAVPVLNAKLVFQPFQRWTI
jgi:hypothetical protein